MADYTLTKTGAEIDAIGNYETTSSSLTSFAPNTETDLCSLTLPAGVWVVNGYLRFTRGSEYFQASLAVSNASGSSQVGNAGYTQFPVTEECNIPAVGVTRIFSLSAQTTVYLVAWHNGTTDKTINATHLQAVRIK